MLTTGARQDRELYPVASPTLHRWFISLSKNQLYMILLCGCYMATYSTKSHNKYSRNEHRLTLLNTQQALW